MEIKLDSFTFNGERVIVYIGGSHVRTSEVSFSDNPDIEEIRNGGDPFMYFTPLGHYVQSTYQDKAGFVDLTGCNYEEIPFCTETILLHP